MNSEKITCVRAQFCTRGLSLETTKKGESMWGIFGNHRFFEGKQGSKGSKQKIPKVEIPNWEILTRDPTEVPITKSVRRLAQLWLAIRQKKHGSQGDFS